MKKNLRFRVAMLAGKAAMIAQRLLGMNATYFPGKLAIRLCPDFLGRIEKPKTVLGVTGTNGKTTCCNLLLNILTDQGYDVISNKLGSNINAGIASTLIGGSSITGRARHDVALLEIDERSSKRIYPYVKPDYVLCTNLFRDTVTREAHPEFVFHLISDSLPKESKLILNGDDLLSSRLAPQNERVYYAIARMPSDAAVCENIVNDMRLCPQCHAPLQYEYVRHHHIGHAHCPQCGFASPEAKYEAQLQEQSMKLEETSYPLMGDSLFNAYNLLGVVALLKEFGLSSQQIQESLKKINIVESRYSSEKIGQTTVITHMAKGKNAVACSCVFDYVRKEPGTKEIILALDDYFDRKGSSENICWYYDTDFEFLNDASIKRILIGGVRAEDLKLRLLIAGVPEEKIVCTHSEMDTPELLKLDTDTIYILHELYLTAAAMTIRDRVKARLRQKEGEKTDAN